MFGGVQSERIQLNEDTIWAGEKRDRNNPEGGGGCYLQASPKKPKNSPSERSSPRQSGYLRINRSVIYGCVSQAKMKRASMSESWILIQESPA